MSAGGIHRLFEVVLAPLATATDTVSDVCENHPHASPFCRRARVVRANVKREQPRRAALVCALVPLVLAATSTCSTSGGRSDDSSAAPGSTSTSSAPSDLTSTSSSPSTTVPSSVYDPYDHANPATADVGTVTDEWIETPDGRQRHFRLYVPSTYRPDQSAPLLIALHGGLGTSEQFASNSGFDGLSESNGFIVVYPDGIRAIPDRPGLQTWNGGYCCGPAANKDVDDVGYLSFLLDLLEARFSIDSGRVFATGHSNGAIMAYRLACELSDRIVAIGVQAGSLGIDECAPSHPVALLHVHGLADTNHPIDGGLGTGVSGVEFRSGREAVRTLAELNRCDVEPTVVKVPSNPDLEVSTWSDCAGDADVRLIAVDGASHAWMGHAGASEEAAGLVGEPYPDFDSSRAIWSFLAGHPRN